MMSFSSQIPVISIFSVTDPLTKMLLTVNLAKSYARTGYKTLIIDLDMNFPALVISLGLSDSDNSLSTNSWLFNPEVELESLTSQLFQIKVSDDAPNLSISYSEANIKKIQSWDNLTEKELSREFRRLSKFIRLIKKHNTFDLILINLPFSLPKAVLPIINSTLVLALVDHNNISVNLLKMNLDSTTSIHPLLKFHGAIIHKFAFEFPEKDQEEIIKIEEKLLLPVLAILPDISSSRYTTTGNLVNWSFQDKPETIKLYDKLARDIEIFAEKPRVIKRKTKIRKYSLFIISDSGLPIFSHYFLPQSETDQILASAGLSAMLSGVSAMISELVDRKELTKLIELKKASLIIEEWHSLRFILLSSEYEEELRNQLRIFARKFCNKYQDQINQFQEISIEPSFEDVTGLLGKVFDK